MDDVEHASAVWPEGQEYLRPIVATLYLLVVGLLSVLLTRRWGSWSYMKRLPLIQLLVIVLLAGSLAFVFISAILVLGVGSSYSEAACNGGIWLCIILYASSKAVLYYLLLEKLQRVHAHSVTGRIGRWKSWWYRGGVVLFVAWLGVAAAMVAGRIGLIRAHDGACVIGLRLYATVPMLTVDAITNIYLTTGFVLPVWRSQNEKARRLAKVSSIAAVAALVTSFANILILSILHGHQLSFVCLGSCGLDVAFNSVTCYLVTTAKHARDEQTTRTGSTDLRGMEFTGGAGAVSGTRGGGGGTKPSFTGEPSAYGGGGGRVSSGVFVSEEVHVDSELDEELHVLSSRRTAGLSGIEARKAGAGPGLLAIPTVSFSNPEVDTPRSESDEDKVGLTSEA